MKTKGYIDNIHTPTSKGFIHNIDPLIPQASYCSGFTAEARFAIRRLRENLHSFGVYFPLKP